jgi:SagB-type dehydrogenase family enzyme
MDLAALSAAPRSRPGARDRGAGDHAFRELYRLRPDATLASQDDGSILLQQPRFEARIAAPTVGRRAMLLRLAGQWTDDADLCRVIAATEGERGIMRGQLLLRRLEAHSWLSRRLQAGDRPLLEVLPVALGSGSAPQRVRHAADVRYTLSRFTTIAAEAGLVAQAPFSPVAVAIRDARVAGLLAPAAAAGCTPRELARLAGIDLQAAAAVLDALLTARILVSAAERRAETCEPPKAVWSPHELALHHRARSGWHALPNGGTFRFDGKFPSEPIARETADPPAPSAAVDLPVPDLGQISGREPSLTEVVTSRRSIRNYDDASPITVGQLAEFLYRVQHTSALRDTDDGQGVGQRPYPAGGQLCELEVYPLVSRCTGLEPGLFRYDSIGHRLIRLAPLHDAAERMLRYAGGAGMLGTPPQVLLVITARAQRVLWKYEGMGYELALKNSGVLTGLMYLVATAMGLAPCALGTGDSAAFALLSGIDPLVEPYIADFAIGSTAQS